MLLSRASRMFKTSIPFAATRKVYLMSLLAFSIAVAIAAALWAAIKIKDTMFSIPLLILLVLLSVAEGALSRFNHVNKHQPECSQKQFVQSGKPLRRCT
jgi:hypothetical protein